MTDESPIILKPYSSVHIAAKIVLYIFWFLSFLFVGLIFLYFTESTPRALMSLQESVSNFGLLWVAYGLFYFGLIRPIALTEFHVFTDHLVVLRNAKSQEIPFGEIASIKLQGLNVLRIFLKNKKSIKLSHQIPRKHLLLDRVATSVSSILEETTYQKTRTRLIVMDQARERNSSVKWMRTSIGLLAPTLMGVLYAWQVKTFGIKNHEYFVTNLMLNFFVPLTLVGFVAFAATEWWIGRESAARLKKDPQDVARNPVYEKKIFRRSAFAYGALSIALFLAIAVFDLNAFTTMRFRKSYPHLGISAGQSAQVDGRYNCLNCRYSLRKGDLIDATSRRSYVFGVIEALPGEKIPMSALAGRSLATEETYTVPENRVIVRSAVDPTRVHSVGLKYIRGRITISQ